MARIPRQRFNERMQSLDRLGVSAELMRTRGFRSHARDLEFAIEIGREAVKKMHYYETELAKLRHSVFTHSSMAHKKMREVTKCKR